jgi:hypothetical protein
MAGADLAPSRFSLIGLQSEWKSIFFRFDILFWNLGASIHSELPPRTNPYALGFLLQ